MPHFHLLILPSPPPPHLQIFKAVDNVSMLGSQIFGSTSSMVEKEAEYDKYKYDFGHRFLSSSQENSVGDYTYH